MSWGDEDAPVKGWGDDDPVVAEPPRKRAPAPKPRRGILSEATGALANFNAGFPLFDEIAAGVNTGVNVLSGKVPLGASMGANAMAIGREFDRSMAGQRALEQDFSQRRPNAAALARGTGMAASVAVPATRLAAPVNATRRGNAMRGAVLAGTQGAAYAATDRGTIPERLQAASKAAVNPLTLALGGALGGAVPGPRRAPKRVDPAVRTLAEEGVPMTHGQMRGGLPKAIEDAATSVPILGDAIQKARQTGLEGFNRAAASRALKPVGETLPEGLTGSQAVAHAGDVLSRRYDELIPRGSVTVDDALADAMERLGPDIATLSPAAKAQLENIIRQRLVSKAAAGNTLPGAVYKDVQQGLGYEASAYGKSQDPDHQKIGKILGGVKEALTEAARRSDPRFAAELRKVDQGWAWLTRVETAAAKAGEGGIFTPAQLDMAVKAGSDTVRRRGYARGEALGYDLSQAGRAVLPSKLPDSGTAKRAMVGMVLGGGGYGLGGPMGVAGAAGALYGASKAYDPRVIDAANRALNTRLAREEAQAALFELKQAALRSPEARAVYEEVLARLSRTAAAVGSGVPNPQQNAMTTLPQ